MDGKDEQSDQYDGGEGQSTEFGIYSQPHGVRRFMDSVKRLGSMNKRQAVVKKGKRNTGHEQVQDIFISPTLPRESKPDGSEANDDHPPEVFGYPAGSRRPTVDDRKTDSLAVNDVSTNPIYSVNRSQFTGSSVTYQNIDAFPTSRPIQSTTLPVSPSSDIAPPIPPKSLTLLRRSDNTRNNYPSFDDNVVPDIPPPPPPLPSTPSLGVSSRSPSPSILRSSGVGEARAISYGQGRIDLNRDNMMF
ncbi:hypothetical protein LSH36_890g00040 [Paralvinella palmiformis]|uniref:Uncharacterized protein n=1 Tax=Paralvinella palmiformis TaxID=53620 RepID=A0AAD9IZI7_9ANNE|nr:hypothetical protein LSH36_890g00040 [Paralvinella palmiformis]